MKSNDDNVEEEDHFSARQVMPIPRWSSDAVTIAALVFVFVQGFVGLLVAFYSRPTMEFLGIAAVVVSTPSLVAMYKRHVGGVFVQAVFASAFCAMLLFWAVLYWHDYHAKCVDDMDLYQRFAPETWGINCGSAMFTCAALAMYIVYEGGVVWMMWWLFISLTRGSAVATYGEGAEVAPLVAPVPHSRVSALYHVGGVMVVVGLVFGTMFLVFPAMPVSFDASGFASTCPVGADFLPRPMENELACCAFHNPATCCRRAGSCQDKTEWSERLNLSQSLGEQSRCDDLLGLLSCAPCNPDACTFTSSIQGVERMCVDFCSQTFHACSGLVLSDNETVAHHYGNNSRRFCEELLEVQVIPDPPKPIHQCGAGAACFSRGGVGVGPGWGLAVGILVILVLIWTGE